MDDEIQALVVDNGSGMVKGKKRKKNNETLLGFKKNDKGPILFSYMHTVFLLDVLYFAKM